MTEKENVTESKSLAQCISWVKIKEIQEIARQLYKTIKDHKVQFVLALVVLALAYMTGFWRVGNKSVTCLPQNDNDKETRMALIKKQRDTYHLCQRRHGFPMEVKDVPSCEKFSLFYQIKLGFVKARESIFIKFFKWWKNTPITSLTDITKLYTDGFRILNVFPKPKGLVHFYSDVHFGLLRLNGVNHAVIRRVKTIEDIPESFDLDKPKLEKFMDRPFDSAIANKKMFIVDLKVLENLPTPVGRKLCAPIGLFYQNEYNELRPIGIQLYQQKSVENPVFYPSDPEYTWMMAKMWFNNADACYHQSLSHLGFTHLAMEGIAVITKRELSERHPIYKLLEPHFLYVMHINQLAYTLLLNKGGFIDETMNAGTNGTEELLQQQFQNWELGTHGNLPKDLIERGMMNDEGSDVLPDLPYYFAKDALLLYKAIKRYVSDYVELYYSTEADLIKDSEIQRWRNKMSKERPKGLGLKGVLGSNEKGFTTTRDLVSTIASIIYICSVGHASVNFGQYDQYAYPPNYPSLLKGTPPKTKDPLKEPDLIKALPDTQQTFEIMDVTRLLSERATNGLGYFDNLRFSDDRAIKVLEGFRDKLGKINTKIAEREETEHEPYDYLLPSKIPNAISI